MANIRVIRVLEYTGPEDWVRTTLAKSSVTPEGIRPAIPTGQIKVIAKYEDPTYRHKDDPVSAMNIGGHRA